MINESQLRRFQLNQSGMPNPDDPKRLADENRWVANSTTTQPASYAQRRNTGTTTVGGNMQPPSARPAYAGVMNTWSDTKGNIAPSPYEDNPQLARTGSPEDKAQETLARYVAMIKEAQQKQA